MIEKLKDAWRAIVRTIRTLMHFLKDALKEMFFLPIRYIERSSWKKLLLVDFPLYLGILTLGFLAGGFWLLALEVLVIALIAFYFSSAVTFKQPALKNLLGLVVGLVGASVGLGLWFWAREVAIILAAAQIPRLTYEAKEAFMEGYNRVLQEEECGIFRT